MLYEPTTLATVARLIGETLEKDYGIDPAPAFAQANIDTRKFARPGSRVPLSKMTKLWDTCVFITHDQQFGVKAGLRSEPSDYYVLGHAWLASATLRGGLERLTRYAHVLSTAIATVEVREEDGMLVFVETAKDPDIVVHRTADEAGIVSFFKLCEIIKRAPVRPIKVELVFPQETARDYLEEYLACPVTWGNKVEKFYFNKEEFEEPLPGSIPDVLDSTSRIAERYLESLDASKVATEVRQLLIQMLPSGKADQETVAEPALSQHEHTTASANGRGYELSRYSRDHPPQHGRAIPQGRRLLAGRDRIHAGLLGPKQLRARLQAVDGYEPRAVPESSLASDNRFPNLIDPRLSSCRGAGPGSVCRWGHAELRGQMIVASFCAP